MLQPYRIHTNIIIAIEENFKSSVGCFSYNYREHIPAFLRYKCWVGSIRMMQHRSEYSIETEAGGAEVSIVSF